MQPNRLPVEVIRAALQLIPKDSLAPASLVCKTWRSIALPRLYESIVLYRYWNQDQSQLLGQDELARRILDELESEKDGDVVQLSSYVKHLRADLTLGNEPFLPAVLRMKNLEHLEWDISLAEDTEWYTTLVNLYQELPKLRSLTLTMGQKELSLGELDEVVAFTNLRELAIKFDGVTEEDPDEELPDTLVEFIRGACNIESLRLAFEEHAEFGTGPWGPIEMFSALATDHFSNLRKLEVESQYLAPIDNFSGPHIRQFIQSHSQLRKIAFLTGGYDDGPELIDQPPLIVTPVDMEEMMPSIRHFEGPGLPIKALLDSKLAKQIELLALREPAVDRLGDLSSLLPELDSPHLPELPSLKGLALYMNGCGTVSDWETIVNALSNLPIRVPVLQELIICSGAGECSPEELDELLIIVEHLPHLRRLVIQFPCAGNKASQHDAIQSFYERARALCPLLDIEDTRNLGFSLNLL